MHLRVAAGAVLVGALGLAGCSNQPNDLRSYAGEQASTSAEESSNDGNSSTAARSESRRAPQEQARRLRPTVRAALLTGREVATEGVRPVPPEPPEAPAAVTDCLRHTAGPSGELVREAATWEYETGARLRQVVLGYPAGEAARVAGRAAGCGQRPLDAHAARGVETVTAWCTPRPVQTCAALLAEGRRLSTVAVSGTSEQRAEEAVLRLAPLAAERLRAPQPG